MPVSRVLGGDVLSVQITNTNQMHFMVALSLMYGMMWYTISTIESIIKKSRIKKT